MSTVLEMQYRGKQNERRCRWTVLIYMNFPETCQEKLQKHLHSPDWGGSPMVRLQHLFPRSEGKLTSITQTRDWLYHPTRDQYYPIEILRNLPESAPRANWQQNVSSFPRCLVSPFPAAQCVLESNCRLNLAIKFYV